jgi:hypothetical protein
LFLICFLQIRPINHRIDTEQQHRGKAIINTELIHEAQTFAPIAALMSWFFIVGLCSIARIPALRSHLIGKG